MSLTYMSVLAQKENNAVDPLIWIRWWVHLANVARHYELDSTNYRWNYTNMNHTNEHYEPVNTDFWIT